MKKVILTFCMVFFSVFAFAAPKNFDYKVDFDAAKEDALKNGKIILLVLTRPQTCSLCVNFAENVLKNSSFKAYAKKHLNIVYIEFNKERELVVKEKEAEQIKTSRTYARKHSDYKTLPGVFLIDPKSDKDMFIKSPEVSRMKASDFLKLVRKFKKEIGAKK